MYESFYGLNEKPFNLNPDPDYLYMSEGHENTLTHLQYAISENKGFVVVTGEIGAGKTTLINYLLGEIPSDIDVGLVNNTHIPASQFIKLVCREFELDITGLDRTAMIDRFHEFLLEMYTNRRRVVLIVDEAQNLNPKTLEEIRLLSNLESEKHHLLQIILVGQPELKLKLQRHDLQQLAQRVTVHCHLKGLNEADVANYICYRLEVAGGDKDNCNIFDQSAIHEICENSKGIPRLINIICDTALVFGYADSVKQIDGKIIRDVVKERAAGGLFSPVLGDDETAIPPSDAGRIADQAVVAAGADGAQVLALQMRVDELTARLSKVETALEKANARLDQKWDYRSRRDDLMIELFKMLRQSMDHRLDTLMRVSRISK
jgi:general secretion pathway protein A